MKRFATMTAMALFALSLTFTASATPGDDDEKTEAAITALNTSATNATSAAQWQVFSQNLVYALQSDHDAMREAAMRLVIRHGSNVDVRPAVFDVMRVYRDHKDENMRRMAIVALGQMDSKWAIRFLERSAKFEGAPALRQTIKAVVADYKSTQASLSK